MGFAGKQYDLVVKHSIVVNRPGYCPWLGRLGDLTSDMPRLHASVSSSVSYGLWHLSPQQNTVVEDLVVQEVVLHLWEKAGEGGDLYLMR